MLATLAIVRLLEHVTTVPTVAPTLATMIGLGVGIDYALMAAIAVVIAVLAALTLLPAVLAIIGAHIESLRVRAPHSTTARQAYDLIAKGFGPGVNGPLIVAVSLGSPAQPSAGSAADPRANDPRLQALQRDIAATHGVATVTPIQLDKSGTTGFFNVIAKTGPAKEATAKLVEHLCASVIPKAAQGTNMRADVGGSTAGYVDLAARISSKLPPQTLIVILLSFALLVLSFRTVVIPPQAAIMNLLSIGALALRSRSSSTPRSCAACSCLL